MLSQEEYGLVAAMLVGESAALNPELKELYQKNGIAHLLAISGLHVTLLGMSVYRLLRRVKVYNQTAVAISIGSILYYGMLTGFSVSTSRAVVMLITALLATLIGRTYDVYCAMAVSSLLILTSNPLQMYSAGFQLSYTAILGIVLVHSSLEKRLQLKNMIGKTLLFGVCVQSISLPLVLYHFYEFPLYAAILNLILLPISSLLIGTALAGGVVGCFWPVGGGFLMGTVSYLLKMIQAVCRLFGSLPGSTQTWGRPDRLCIVVYLIVYLGAVTFLYYLSYLQSNLYQLAKKKGIKEEECEKYIILSNEADPRIRQEDGVLLIDRSVELIGLEQVPISFLPSKIKLRKYIFIKSLRRKTYLLITVFLLLDAIVLLPQPVRGIRITMMDVGQGDGICLETNTGHSYLVDGGSSKVKHLAKYRLIPFLKYHGKNHLDAVILTHADQDHISGIEELLALEYPIDRIILPDSPQTDVEFSEILKQADMQGVPVIRLSQNQRIQDGELRLTCLNPVLERIPSTSNAGSLVLMLEYGAFQMLLTGDVESEGEDHVISYLKEHPMDFDVLKVAHHGSDHSTSEQLLSVIKPEYALISVGKKNTYGHPGKRLMKRLIDARCQIYETRNQGAVRLEIFKHSMNIMTYLK